MGLCAGAHGATLPLSDVRTDIALMSTRISLRVTSQPAELRRLCRR